MNERETLPVGFKLGREISEEEQHEVSGGFVKCWSICHGISNSGNYSMDWSIDSL